MKIKVSVAILTRNSLKNIEKIAGILSNFNEVLIIDDYSDDGIEIFCLKSNYIYFKRRLNGNFASQRNYALTKAKNDWVLFLDSDESFGEAFIQNLDKVIKEGNFDGFYIPRKVNFLGHLMKGTEMGNDRILRLARKDRGGWFRKVHEHWVIKGKIGEFDHPIVHNTAENLKMFIDKINSYHEIHAEENLALGKKPSILKILLYPLFKFMKNVMLLKGFKDNAYGFVVSVMMSFHTFLSWSDAWLIKKKNIKY